MVILLQAAIKPRCSTTYKCEHSWKLQILKELCGRQSLYSHLYYLRTLTVVKLRRVANKTKFAQKLITVKIHGRFRDSISNTLDATSDTNVKTPIFTISSL